MRINSIQSLLNIQKNQTVHNKYTRIYPNLAPLDKDTVSFSGKVLKTSSKNSNPSIRPSIHTAQKVYDEAKNAYSTLHYIMQQTFDAPVIDTQTPFYEENLNRAINSNSKSPIVAITTRRKSAESIAEKMSVLGLNSKEEAKRNLNDIIGARIIVSGNSKKEGDYVLEKLAQAVKKGRIKIKTVKNHGQDDSNLDYVSKKGLGSFLKIAKGCKYKNQPRDTGYLALHLITDEIQDGYNAEIQIMGLDVARFKKLEDLCYKCNTNKQVPAKYREIEQRFKKIQGDEDLKKDFYEYTKRSYARQRSQSRRKGEPEFLPIPKDLKIPKDLDFNRVMGLKRKIDLK